ncbi:site-specific integrase [Pseudomonas sp. RIT409]|nr:site-specific integrase [Pseudomonas sp. RIT 409]
MVDRYLRVLAFLATCDAPRTVLNIDQAFRKLAVFSGARVLDSGLLLAFRNEGDSQDFHLASIRTLFRAWANLGYYGVDRSVLSVLNSWRLKPPIRGDAVKRMDPNVGPLSSLELQSLLERAAQAFEANWLTVTELSLLLLSQASGRRTYQLACIKLKDVKTIVLENGVSRYFVDIPRAKQRSGGFRKSFRKIELIKEYWDTLQSQCNYVVDVVCSRFFIDSDDPLLEELPLFIDLGRLSELFTYGELAKVCAGDYLHMPRKKIREIVIKAVEVSDVISERTQDVLKVTPRRFRYTLAYRAAREGCGAYVIAELLDQSDIQNVDVYTATVPEHAAHIESVVGQHLIPIANAFAGIIVTDRTKAKRGSAIQGDIRDLSGKSTGACGKDGTCGAGIPIPCYTCIHFQAWLDGPHEELYKSLVNERARLLDVTKDASVAGALDRTILAVSEVVSVCQARKASLSEDR